MFECVKKTDVSLLEKSIFRKITMGWIRLENRDNKWPGAKEFIPFILLYGKLVFFSNCALNLCTTCQYVTDALGMVLKLVGKPEVFDLFKAFDWARVVTNLNLKMSVRYSLPLLWKLGIFNVISPNLYGYILYVQEVVTYFI